MDPLQFRIDWEILTEVLVTIVVLSFFVERALSIVVENKLFVRSRLDDIGLKEILSLILSFFVVKVVGFDALAIVFRLDDPTIPGFLITAGVISGGSKASIKFFHDVLGVKSAAVKEKDDQKKAIQNKPAAQQQGAPGG